MKISARIATTASSEESTPNIGALSKGLAAFVVSRRRSDGLVAARGHVDRLLRPHLIARQLAWRLVPPLLIVAALLVVVLVGHPLLEAFQPLGDVSHHR